MAMNLKSEIIRWVIGQQAEAGNFSLNPASEPKQWVYVNHVELQDSYELRTFYCKWLNASAVIKYHYASSRVVGIWWLGDTKPDLRSGARKMNKNEEKPEGKPEGYGTWA